MIGTAFYALGVIACMILIVAGAVAGIAVVVALLPYLLGFAALAIALWIVLYFLGTSIGQWLALAALVTGFVWLMVRDKGNTRRKVLRFIVTVGWQQLPLIVLIVFGIIIFVFRQRLGEFQPASWVTLGLCVWTLLLIRGHQDRKKQRELRRQHPQPGDPDYLDWANRRGKYAVDADYNSERERRREDAVAQAMKGLLRELENKNSQ